jgi:hypothetical protein
VIVVRRWVGLIGGVLLLALGSACGKKALQMDAGGTGWIDPSGDGGIDAGPDLLPDDGPPPFLGLRSFVVTSTFPQDGSTSGVSSHTFTLILNGDQRVAIAGGAREGAQFGFGIDGGGAFHSTQPIKFAIASGCQSSVTYSALTFTIDAAGALAGTARGNLILVSGDVGMVTSVTTSLAGVPDTEAPRLSLAASPDPLAPVVVWAAEPLPRGPMPTLISAGGDSVALLAPPSLDPFVWQFSKRARMLRYDDTYSLVIAGIADFAGNEAMTASTGFTTGAPPPLAPEDGFESVTDTTLGGAEVLSGSGAPVIAGARSLYVPPVTAPTSSGPRFEVRLPVAAGDTALHFSYRTVNAGDPSTASYRIGSAGGSIVEFTLPGEPVQTTPATINGNAVMLSPLTTIRVPLPGDVGGEIVLQRTVQPPGCTRPFLTVSGIIVDDLRVE